MTKVSCARLAVASLSLLIPLAARVPAQRTLVLTDVTLVDVVNERTVPAQTLVLAGGRIEQLGPDGETPAPIGALFVDGSGRYVIPGLWDMHVHDIEREETLPLYPAHGVTGVRAMGGDAQACIDVRDRIASGTLLGPRIVTAGPFLDGRWPGDDRWVLEDADEAHAAVRRLVALHADFVKVHDALSQQAFDGVIEAAGPVSLPVVGHVPRSVSYEDAVTAGMASIEHVNQLAERLLTSGSMASEDALDAEVAALVGGRGGALFAAMVEHGTAFTPTLIAHEGLLRGADPDSGAWNDPRLAWLPPSMAVTWRELLPVDQLPPGFVRERRFVHRASMSLVRAMHDAGVQLLAGSDAGAPHVYPGSGLIDELEQLVACGLSPAQALRTATTAPAAFFGETSARDGLSIGAPADLVLLDANPLEDIAHLRCVDSVVVRGRLHDRAALDAWMTSAAASAGVATGAQAESPSTQADER